MAGKMEIDLALTNLEAGKFSFRMVDAIKEHIDGLEKELGAVRDLHAGAVSDLKRQELANWRLEGEVRKLNAKVYALLRANMLTEIAVREATAAMARVGEFLEAVKKEAVPAAIGLTRKTYLETKPVAIKAGAYLLAATRNHAAPAAAMLAQKALREMKPLTLRIGAYLQMAQKRARASLEKALAYLSTLNKNAA